MTRTILTLVLLLLAADTTLAQQRSLGASATASSARDFRGQVGRRVTFVCPAAVPLTTAVWGTDVYTDDSPVCTAAIHAGVLKPSAAGAVTVVIGGAAPTLKGTTRNGVTSRVWGGYPGTFTFDSSGEPGQVDWSTTARLLPTDVELSLIVTCPPQGVLTARVWGTDTYSDDSAVCVAAVHAGILTAATGGRVQVRNAPGEARYKPSVRNGVTSLAWGAHGSSFRMAATPPPAAAAFIGPAPALRSATAVVPPATQGGATAVLPPAQQATAILPRGMQSATASAPPASGAACGTEFANFCIAAINPASIRVNWAARTDATHYRIRRGGQILTEVAAPAREFVDESLTPGQTAEYTLEALRAAGSVNVGLGAFPPTLNESGRNADGSRSVNAGDSSQRLTRFASLQTAPAKSATTPTLAIPTGVTARSIAGPKGRVRVAWSPVPGANGYLVYRDGNPLPVDAAAATNNSSDDTGAPLGRRKYQVEALFTAPTSRRTVNGQASAEVFAEVTFPQPSIPFLSRPAGPGNADETIAHYRTRCSPDMDQRRYPPPLALQQTDLNACAQPMEIFEANSNFFENWSALLSGGFGRDGGKFRGRSWSLAAFADVNVLGLGRRVNCAQRRSAGGPIVCWATSHGSIPAPGANVNGSALASLGATIDQIKSLNVIMAYPDGRMFFGTWETGAPTHGLGSFDNEFQFVKDAKVRFATQLDNQGPKPVPHACLSCHGGNYDPKTGMVVGASLLPLVPAVLEFQSPGNRSSQEEEIRKINEIVLSSNPAPAIAAQINALYGGSPRVAGTPANDAAIPAGWRTDPNIYKQVIEPYCAACHFSRQGPLSFASVADARTMRGAIQATTCTTFTMPHSEAQFRRFWTEGGNVSLPGLLSTWLGFSSCGP